MNEFKIPECMKNSIEEFNDKLSTVLTSWEQGEISDFELYDFMVDIQNKISTLQYA